jgi:hypothetical protein
LGVSVLRCSQTNSFFISRIFPNKGIEGGPGGYFRERKRYAPKARRVATKRLKYSSIDVETPRVLLVGIRDGFN